MFEAETRLDILERLKNYYAELNEGKVSADEGTFSFDELSANAKEFEKTYAEMELIVEAGFPQTSWGVYLDYLADALTGLSRRKATAAEVELTITGKAGTIIPAGYIFSTDSGVSFALKADAEIGTDGNVAATATSTTTGAGGNVKAGTVTLIPVPLYGVETVTNAAAAHDGYERKRRFLTRTPDVCHAASGHVRQRKSLLVVGHGGVRRRTMQGHPIVERSWNRESADCGREQQSRIGGAYQENL